MFLVSGFQSFPDRLPNKMLLICVRRVGNLLTAFVAHRERCDPVSTCSIIRIAESRVVWIQLNNRIAIRRCLVRFSRYQSHVYVVQQKRVFDLGYHFSSPSSVPLTSPQVLFVMKKQPATDPSHWKDRWPVMKLV